MIQWNQWNQRNQRSSGGLYVVSSATLTARSGSRFHHESSGMFINLVCFKLPKLFQWPNILSQPYPLAPYGGLPSTPIQEAPHQSVIGPNLRTCSLPSGGVTRTTKRGRSRASGSRKVKPYENSEQEREEKIFHDVIWRSAKHWFVLKLWREGCFFVKFDVEDATVDRCAIEAYEAAISEYRDNDHPDGAGLIAKYRLQPQATGALIKCCQVVSAVVAICGSSLF